MPDAFDGNQFRARLGPKDVGLPDQTLPPIKNEDDRMALDDGRIAVNGIGAEEHTVDGESV
jgi:hypothetical protein